MPASKISVPLPCIGALADITTAPVAPTLQQVFETSGNITTLSGFASAAVVMSLYRLCFNHKALSAQDSSYHFWDSYYRIDNLIGRCRTGILAQHLHTGSMNSPQDTLSLILSMNLAAVEIYLHKIAIVKVEKEQISSALSAEAETRCLAASTDILEALRACRRLPSRELNVLQQSSMLFTWALTQATQTHLWMLVHDKSSSHSAHINSLRVLLSAMRELIGPEHCQQGLLEQVEAKIAEAGRPRKRSRAQVSDEHFHTY